MSKSLFTRRCVLKSAVLLRAQRLASAQSGDPAPLPGLVWETAVESPEHEIELKASVLSLDGAKLWAVLGTRPKGRLSGAQSLVLRHWDSGGRESSNLPLDQLADLSSEKSNRARVDAMAALPDGRVLLALAQPGNEVLVLVVDPSGARVVLRKSVAFAGEGTAVSSVLPTSQGFLIVGALDLRGWIAHVTLDGKVLWSNKLDGKARLIWSAAQTPNGFLLTGSNSGGTELWVAEVSGSGTVKAEAWLPGTYPLASVPGQPPYGLVYEKPGPKGIDVVFRSVAPGLKLADEQVLMKGLALSPRLRIVPSPSGHIIAAVRERSLWMAGVTSAGALTWTHSQTPALPNLIMYSTVSLHMAGPEATVAATAFKVIGGREQRQFVQLLRFRPK